MRIQKEKKNGKKVTFLCLTLNRSCRYDYEKTQIYPCPQVSLENRIIFVNTCKILTHIEGGFSVFPETLCKMLTESSLYLVSLLRPIKDLASGLKN